MRIIKFNNPDYVEYHYPFFELSYLGCNHEDWNGKIGKDVWHDIWGTGWRNEEDSAGEFPIEYPLANTSELDRYDWPDADNKRLTSKIYRQYEQCKKEFDLNEIFLAGSNRDTLWEKAYMLCGMENLMVQFYENPGFARKVLRKIMDFQLKMAEIYVELGIDIAHMTDDLGTQRNLILPPKIIGEFLFPEYKRLFDFYKANNVLVNFHSCGHIEPVIDMFIELGVDVLNPVQETANNLEAVRLKTAGKIAMMGCVSSYTIMTGSAEEIENSVKEKINLLHINGGYFCMHDQDIDFPKENIEVFKCAVKKYGCKRKENTG